MDLYELNRIEESKHLNEVAERIKAGSLKWECIEYSPISLMDEDLVDEKPAFLSHSIVMKTSIEGIPYTLEFMESIEIPSGMGDIGVTLIRDISDDYRRIDYALSYCDDYEDCQPGTLREAFRGEVPVIMSDILIPQAASSECIPSAFSFSRFYYGGEIPRKLMRHPLVKLGQMLYKQQRVLDFHRCVLDTDYRKKALAESK